MGTDSREVPIYDQDRVPPNATYPYIGVTYDKVDPPAGWGPDEVIWFFKKAVLWTARNSYNLGFTEDTFSFERARQRAYTILYNEGDDDMPGLVEVF